MAAAGKHDSAAKLGHGMGEASEEQFHAAEGDDEVAVTGNVEGRDGDLFACEGREELPTAVDVAIPVQAATESRARKFLRIEIDVGIGEPWWK